MGGGGHEYEAQGQWTPTPTTPHPTIMCNGPGGLGHEHHHLHNEAACLMVAICVIGVCSVKKPQSSPHCPEAPCGIFLGGTGAVAPESAALWSFNTFAAASAAAFAAAAAAAWGSASRMCCIMAACVGGWAGCAGVAAGGWSGCGDLLCRGSGCAPLSL